MNSFKWWGWLLLLVTIVGLTVVFFINYVYYANVIVVGFYASALLFQIFWSYQLMKYERRSDLVVNAVVLVSLSMIFLFSIPTYSYKDAKQLVASEYGEKAMIETPPEQRTVPTKESSSWFLYDKSYYVAVKQPHIDAFAYYVVDPNNGKPKRLQNPAHLS